MVRVGFIGWRGMVGSVLMDRMRAENDFHGFEPLFFSTSQAGEQGPDIGHGPCLLEDAMDVGKLSAMDVLVSCQGSDYTKDVYPRLRSAGWKGFLIDAASALRMEPASVIVLDPVNRDVIDRALQSGVRDFIGGNCTVSLMLMAVGGLFRKGYVEWVSSMTYQAASGAGAKNMRELVAQMAAIGRGALHLVEDPQSAILDLDRQVLDTMKEEAFPLTHFGAPLAGSAIAWIDSPMETGQTREEWKGYAETNKILQTERPIPIDGICVRIGAMRCHSQGLTIKLNRDIPVDDIRDILLEANQWVRFVPNTKADTLRDLTPAAVSGTLLVPFGRLRKLNMGPEYVTLFTVGDQLLWGAAEPIRRMLRIVLEHVSS